MSPIIRSNSTNNRQLAHHYGVMQIADEAKSVLGASNKFKGLKKVGRVGKIIAPVGNFMHRHPTIKALVAGEAIGVGTSYLTAKATAKSTEREHDRKEALAKSSQHHFPFHFNKTPTNTKELKQYMLLHYGVDIVSGARKAIGAKIMAGVRKPFFKVAAAAIAAPIVAKPLLHAFNSSRRKDTAAQHQLGVY